MMEVFRQIFLSEGFGELRSEREKGSKEEKKSLKHGHGRPWRRRETKRKGKEQRSLGEKQMKTGKGDEKRTRGSKGMFSYGIVRVWPGTVH